MILSALKFCAFSSALISSTSLALSLSFSITSSSEIEPGAHAAVMPKPKNAAVASVSREFACIAPVKLRDQSSRILRGR
jgi:hypothetical protein